MKFSSVSCFYLVTGFCGILVSTGIVIGFLYGLKCDLYEDIKFPNKYVPVIHEMQKVSENLPEYIVDSESKNLGSSTGKEQKYSFLSTSKDEEIDIYLLPTNNNIDKNSYSMIDYL